MNKLGPGGQVRRDLKKKYNMFSVPIFHVSLEDCISEIDAMRDHIISLRDNFNPNDIINGKSYKDDHRCFPTHIREQHGIADTDNFDSVRHSNLILNNDGETYSGFQTDYLNEKEQPTQNFIKAIVPSIYDILTNYHLQQKSQIYFKGIWGNINYSGGTIADHNHPGIHFAGVVYLKVPEGSGSLVLKHPDPIIKYSEFYSTPFKNSNEYNSTIYEILPKEYTMVLFPAHIMHSVMANKTDEERISVAFNLNVIKDFRKYYNERVKK